MLLIVAGCGSYGTLYISLSLSHLLSLHYKHLGTQYFVYPNSSFLPVVLVQGCENIIRLSLLQIQERKRESETKIAAAECEWDGDQDSCCCVQMSENEMAIYHSDSVPYDYQQTQ